MSMFRDNTYIYAFLNIVIIKKYSDKMANHRPSEDVKGNMLYRWLLMVTLPHERAHAQTHIQGSKIYDGWLPSTYIIH